MQEKSNITERFANRLIELRKRHGLSQRALASSTGIDQAFISRLETGHHEPCLHTLKTLADAFEMTIEKLMKGI